MVQSFRSSDESVGGFKIESGAAVAFLEEWPGRRSASVSVTDSFPQSSYCRWTHRVYNDAGQLTATRVYVAIPADSLGRQITKCIGYDLTETSYADASSVTDDTIVEQVEPIYDESSNVIQQRRASFHNATGTGPLSYPGGARGVDVIANGYAREGGFIALVPIRRARSGKKSARHSTARPSSRRPLRLVHCGHSGRGPRTDMLALDKSSAAA